MCVCVWVCVYISAISVCIFCSHTLITWPIRPNVQLVLRATFCTIFPISSFVQCSDFALVITFVSHHIYYNQTCCTGNHMNEAEWTDTYDINQWRVLRCRYRKSALMRFKPLITEFRLDALRDWAIRQWVQLLLRVNFLQLL